MKKYDVVITVTTTTYMKVCGVPSSDPEEILDALDIIDSDLVSYGIAEDVSVIREYEDEDAELEAALAAARERGRLRAADILGSDDMLSAEAFAKILGTTRVTVNTKRQSGQVLGLDGAKLGFRFPVWQLDAEGKPYAELAVLHERLGGPWAVYRFLVQHHGALDGLTGREALERGRGRDAIAAAEGIAWGDFT